MYKLSKIIKQVKGVKTYSNHEIIGYFNKDLYVDSKKISSNVDTTTGSLKIFESYLFFDVNDSNLVYYLENGQLFDFKGFRYYPNSLKNNEIICIYDTIYSNNKFSWRTGLLSFKKQKIIKEFGFLNNKSIAHCLNNDFVIVYKGTNLLSGLSLLTGEYEWEVDLSGRKYVIAGEEHEAKITHIFGVHDDYLYIWLDDNRLVEIDISTGNIKAERFPLQDLQDNGMIQAVLQPQYRESEQSLFFFYQDYLVQVHLPSQTTTLLWQDTRYNVGASFISDEYIYFIGSYVKGAFFRDHIGVFDRQKNEVIWMQQVIELNKETYNNLREIQAAEDKIYVLDTEGTLHIFEKEEDVKS